MANNEHYSYLEQKYGEAGAKKWVDSLVDRAKTGTAETVEKVKKELVRLGQEGRILDIGSALNKVGSVVSSGGGGGGARSGAEIADNITELARVDNVYKKMKDLVDEFKNKQAVSEAENAQNSIGFLERIEQIFTEERAWRDRREEEIPGDTVGLYVEKYGFWVMIFLGILLIIKIVRG